MQGDSQELYIFQENFQKITLSYLISVTCRHQMDFPVWVPHQKDSSS